MYFHWLGTGAAPGTACSSVQYSIPSTQPHRHRRRHHHHQPVVPAPLRPIRQPNAWTDATRHCPLLSHLTLPFFFLSKELAFAVSAFAVVAFVSVLLLLVLLLPKKSHHQATIVAATVNRRWL
jgi:hypothetical protein